MKVTFQLTPEDYHQGCLAWRNLRPWRRWLLRCSYLLVGLTIPMAVLLVFIRSDSQTLKISAAIVAFAVLWFTYMWAAPWFSARRQFHSSPSAQFPITIEASEVGLVLHSAHADSKVSWSAYVAWGEAKSVFVILPQPRIYVLIPKRAFNAEQLGEFREILRRNVVMK